MIMSGLSDPGWECWHSSPKVLCEQSAAPWKAKEREARGAARQCTWSVWTLMMLFVFATFVGFFRILRAQYSLNNSSLRRHLRGNARVSNSKEILT